MSSLAALEKQLAQHFANPQKSERWAMYRIIAPIVDYANESIGLEPYFEFNQTSEHGTSQSVDIALLLGQRPVAMIEAKRMDRRVGAEQIEKYLPKDTRGIVTNGVNWILCEKGMHQAVTIWDEATQAVVSVSVSEVVDFLRGVDSQGEQWTTDRFYVSSAVKPAKTKKDKKAMRRVNPMQSIYAVDEGLEYVGRLEKTTEVESVFLLAFIESLRATHGCIPTGCRLEFRSSRVSFFDDRVEGRSKRVGRIELGKQQADILVASNIADDSPTLKNIATPAPHDKGPHMRRFRLRAEQEAVLFGQALGRLLF